MNKPYLKLQRSKSESGSAVLDFVLVAAPMLLIWVSVIGVLVHAYTLMTLRDTAIEGSRYAALADQSTVSGCDRATYLISKSFISGVKFKVNCQAFDHNGVTFEQVTVAAQLPIIGFLSSNSWLTAKARAVHELD